MDRRKPSHRLQQFAEFDGLRQAGGRFQFTCFLRAEAVAGDDDHGYFGKAGGAHFLHELFAVHARHHQIQKNKRGFRAGFEMIKGVDAVTGNIYGVAVRFQDNFHEFADIGGRSSLLTITHSDELALAEVLILGD